MKHAHLAAALGLMALAALGSSPVAAQNEGLEDLDKAVEARLESQSLSDVSKVIDRLQAALNKGLDGDNTQFARELLVASLLERAEALTGALFDRKIPGGRVPQIRIWNMAVSDADRVVAIDPNRAKAHYLMGRLQALAGNRDKAVESLDKALAEGEQLSTALRASARTLRADLGTDADERRADYDQALELEPDNTDALRARSRFHAEKGELDDALADLSRALEVAPTDAETLADQARLFAVQKKFDEAIKSLDRALELAPESAAIHAQRGQIHRQLDRYEEALADYTRSLDRVPNNVLVRLLRAEVEQLLGHHDEALADVEKVMQLQPGYLPAIRLRAEILAISGRMDEAISSLEGLVEVRVKDTQLQLQLARYYLADEQIGRSVELLNRLLHLAPDDWQALRIRGDARLAVGKQALAIADYESALELKSDNSGLLNNLAWVLATSPNAERRNGQRALQLATKACEVTEYKEAHILSTLAAAYAELGQFDEAVEWSKKAVELGQGGAQWDQLAKELESYEQAEPWREIQSVDEGRAVEEPDVEESD